MTKNYTKLKVVILSLFLVGLVSYIKSNAKEEKVVTLSINSSYVEKIELAEKIISEKRDDVIIDKEIQIDPVVYDLRLFNDDYESEKTNEYFIKEELRARYINKVCDEIGISLDEEELEDYKSNYSDNIMLCRKQREALFNGFESFEAYIDSDAFKRKAILDTKYDKLQTLNSDYLKEYNDLYMDIDLRGFENIVDIEVEELYKKYKNKNRY